MAHHSAPLPAHDSSPDPLSSTVCPTEVPPTPGAPTWVAMSSHKGPVSVPPLAPSPPPPHPGEGLLPCSCPHLQAGRCSPPVPGSLLVRTHCSHPSAPFASYCSHTWGAVSILSPLKNTVCHLLTQEHTQPCSQCWWVCAAGPAAPTQPWPSPPCLLLLSPFSLSSEPFSYSW